MIQWTAGRASARHVGLKPDLRPKVQYPMIAPNPERPFGYGRPPPAPLPWCSHRPTIAARAPLLQGARGVVGGPPPARLPWCSHRPTIAARAPLLQGGCALVGGPPPARCRDVPPPENRGEGAAPTGGPRPCRRAAPGPIAVMFPPPDNRGEGAAPTGGRALAGGPPPARLPWCSHRPTIAARAPLLQGGARCCRRAAPGPMPWRSHRPTIAARAPLLQGGGCGTTASLLRNPSILFNESTPVGKFYTPFSPPPPTPSPCFSKPFTKSSTARSRRSLLPPPLHPRFLSEFFTLLVQTYHGASGTLAY